jgi:hypothetical protein
MWTASKAAAHMHLTLNTTTPGLLVFLVMLLLLLPPHMWHWVLGRQTWPSISCPAMTSISNMLVVVVLIPLPFFPRLEVLNPHKQRGCWTCQRVVQQFMLGMPHPRHSTLQPSCPASRDW